MKQYTHAWLAFMAIKRLDRYEFPDNTSLQRTIKADAAALVKWFKNYRDFVIERFTLFFYSVNGYYDFGNGLRITAEAGLHPCGVLNLSSQYNGWFGNVGLIWKPKN